MYSLKQYLQQKREEEKDEKVRQGELPVTL